MIKVYGLKNCDTCRKALKWLNQEDITHSFHDIRSENPGETVIAGWIDQVGWETLLNRRGTTWRGLGGDLKVDIDGPRAVALIVEHPALIKRPVFETDQQVKCGFTDDVQAWLVKNQ